MSDFSQRLEKEIKNTGKTLYYLSEASGMQLDYISKMSKGKRIPKEEERLTCLLDAMECTRNTRADLLFLYRQEKMGKSQWQCMEELIRIIHQDVVEFPQVSVTPRVSGYGYDAGQYLCNLCVYSKSNDKCFRFHDLLMYSGNFTGTFTISCSDYS